MHLYLTVTDIANQQVYHYVINYLHDKKLANELWDRNLFGVINVVLDQNDFYARLVEYSKTLEPHAHYTLNAKPVITRWQEKDFVTINVIIGTNALLGVWR